MSRLTSFWVNKYESLDISLFLTFIISNVCHVSYGTLMYVDGIIYIYILQGMYK